MTSAGLADEHNHETRAEYVRCKFCSTRWLWGHWQTEYKAGRPMPGKDLKCPNCGLDGMSVVMDFDPQEQLL